MELKGKKQKAKRVTIKCRSDEIGDGGVLVRRDADLAAILVKVTLCKLLILTILLLCHIVYIPVCGENDKCIGQQQRRGFRPVFYYNITNLINIINFEITQC